MIRVFNGDIPNDFAISSSSIAIDTESMGLLPKRDRLTLVQFSFGGEESFLVRFSQETGYSAPNFRKMLSDESLLKIFHYARADLAFIYHYLGVWAKPCYCTKVASRLVRTYTDSHSLRDLCQTLLGVNLVKQQQCSDWGASNLSQAQMSYAANDVRYLHKLKNVLDPMLEREGRIELAQGCFDFLPYRAHLDLMGWGESILAHNTYNNS